LNFRFADFEIDSARQELRRAGAIVHVEPQVFDLLVHLVRNRDRIVSKDELFDAIWQGRMVSEATLSSRISAARRALGDSGNDQSLIRTLHKRGFRFVGDVDDDSSAPDAIAIEKAISPQDEAHDAAKLVPTRERLPVPDESSVAGPSFENLSRDPNQEYVADGLTVAAAARPAFADRASDTTGPYAILHEERAAGVASAEAAALAPAAQRTARNLLVAVAAIGFASLSVSAAWWLLSSPSPLRTPHAKGRVALASQAPSATDRLKAAAPSIVVLPFVNLSGDAKRDYLADGITDSLISDLTHALPGISIASATRRSPIRAGA
jgi:DNA-binding winged helix-turn-helix (wHTH) protein